MVRVGDESQSEVSRVCSRRFGALRLPNVVALCGVFAPAGELVLRGPGPSWRGDFTDIFHAASGLLLHGHLQGSTVRLFGTYPAGDGSPDWGWRIVLDWCDPDRFGLRMFNVLPDGTDVLAVDLLAARAA